MAKTKKQNEEIRKRTREKIIQAALHQFSHKGYAATSIIDIAKHADISTGLMYRHFKSKEELYNLLLNNALTELDRIVDFLSMDMCPINKLVLLTNSLLDEINNNNDSAKYFVLVIQSMLIESTSENNNKIRNNDLILFAKMSEVLAEGQKDGKVKSGDTLLMSMLYFSTIQGVAISKLILGDIFICPSDEMFNSFILKEEI